VGERMGYIIFRSSHDTNRDGYWENVRRRRELAESD
jgi:hypothetical protein